MNRNYLEELANAIRNEIEAEERLIRSECIKEGWRKRKERLELEKEALTLVKANH